jgi:hypothetical protein
MVKSCKASDDVVSDQPALLCTHKPMYGFAILIAGSLLQWTGVKGSALLRFRKARLANAFDDLNY